jgi:hypothetical protein
MHVREEVVHGRGEAACSDTPDDDAQKEGERGAFVFEDVGEFHFRRLFVKTVVKSSPRSQNY